MEILEIVKVVDFEAIDLPPAVGDGIRLRVEIFRVKRGVYGGRLWRIEHYRIQPTFPQQNSKPKVAYADELILVQEHALVPDLEHIFASSPARLLKTIVSRVSKALRRG
jgi:hypothetical protein